MMAVEVHGVVLLAGKSISATYMLATRIIMYISVAS